MSETHQPSPELAQDITSFFARCGADPSARTYCDSLLSSIYPAANLRPAPCQGYCSYTLLVGDDTIAQVRPAKYALDMSICHAAREVYGGFAPETTFLREITTHELLRHSAAEQELAASRGTGYEPQDHAPRPPFASPETPTLPLPLHVYSMERIFGIPYSTFCTLPSQPPSSPPPPAHHLTLSADLASFLALSWLNRAHANTTSLPLGKIGLSLHARLTKLHAELPIRFRPWTSHVLSQLAAVEQLPWVLTHGDLVAGNILVGQDSGRLMGVVDWAEAEVLPFGMGFYGLEEVVGRVDGPGGGVGEQLARGDGEGKARHEGLNRGRDADQDKPQDESQTSKANSHLNQPSAASTQPTPHYHHHHHHHHHPDNPENPDPAACRTAFWSTLTETLPELQNESVLAAVRAAQAAGTLLWWGFAFDDGAIDRVVVEGRDVRELAHLDAAFAS